MSFFVSSLSALAGKISVTECEVFIMSFSKEGSGKGSPTSHLKESKIIYNSLVMRHLMKMIHKVALSDATVLILGESGTGKELIAREIHRKSYRSHQAFIAINCGALHKDLLESELFGYEKGAFTGAFERKFGLLELAHGGTLFLDEIGELSLESQTKLLRFLQESEVFRLGGRNSIKVNTRLISATNRELDQEMVQGRFREDLFYRINAVTLYSPPLRDRKEDIPLLTEYFLSQEVKNDLNKKKDHREKEKIWISPEVKQAMFRYYWPGNVRELQNLCKKIYIFSQDNKLKMEDLPQGVLSSRVQPKVIKEYNPSLSLSELEKEYILKALQYFAGNKTQAARALGITIKTLYNKLHEYGKVKSTQLIAEKEPFHSNPGLMDKPSSLEDKGPIIKKGITFQ